MFTFKKLFFYDFFFHLSGEDCSVSNLDIKSKVFRNVDTNKVSDLIYEIYSMQRLMKIAQHCCVYIGTVTDL
jgi:hypothetical protein